MTFGELHYGARFTFDFPDHIQNICVKVSAVYYIDTVTGIQGESMGDWKVTKQAPKHKTTNPFTVFIMVAAVLLFLLFLCLHRADAQEHIMPKPVHRFNDTFNIALFSADELVRTMDWKSTIMLRDDPCGCYRETQLPGFIANSSPRMLVYSLLVPVALHGVAYVAHRTGHHRIERIIPMLDIVGDGRAVVGNYRLKPPPPASITAVVATTPLPVR